MYWYRLLMPAFGEQRQAHLCEIKATLVHIVSSMMARLIDSENPLTQKKKTEKTVFTF